MAKDNEGHEGVWRTIRGRRVFIRDGEELGSAMARSGKFKNLKREDVVKGKQELENRRLHQQTRDMENAYENNRYGYGTGYWNKELNQARDWENEGKELLDSYYDNPKLYEGDPTYLEGKHVLGREIHVPYAEYGGGYTGGEKVEDYYGTQVYDEDENSVSVLMPHKLGVTKEQLSKWAGTESYKIGDMVPAPYTMSGTYDSENMYEHKVIKSGDYPELETKIPLIMTKDQAKEFNERYKNLSELRNNTSPEEVESDIKSLFIYQNEKNMGAGPEKDPLKKYYDKYGKENVDRVWADMDKKYAVIQGTNMDYEGLRYNELVEKDKYSPEAIDFYRKQVENAWQNHSWDTKKYNEATAKAREEFERFDSERSSWDVDYQKESDEFVKSNYEKLQPDSDEYTNSLNKYMTEHGELGGKQGNFYVYNSDENDFYKAKLEHDKQYIADKEQEEFGAEAQVERFKERKGKDLGINITEAPSRASQKTGLKAEPYKKELDRTVELGLSATSYTAGKDAEILDSISGQLSDGIWENSNMDRYWQNMDFVSENGNIKMATGSRGWYPDYSGYGGYRGGYSNPFSEKDDSQIRTYIADKAKQIVKKNIEDNSSLGKWSRDNTNEVEYMGGHHAPKISVADVYSFYDRVKGRKGKKYNTYGKTSVARKDVDNIKAQVERYKKRKNK